MKTNKTVKTICVSLCLILLMTLLSPGIAAEDGGQNASRTIVGSVWRSNPDAEKLLADARLNTEDTTIEIDPVIYTDREKAAESIHRFIKQRTPQFRILYETDIELSGDDIWALLREAAKHTGDPTEGDYLYFQAASLSYSWGCDEGSEPGMKINTITFTIYYYTTLEQETEMAAALSAIMESLELEGQTDYEKIYRIYKYICENVRYADGIDDDYLIFSAYGALINHEAVCQGYSTLLYRMLLTAGVDARVITGSAAGGAHAWNIVKLDGAYYYLDSTWDESPALKRTDWFLCGETDFPSHEPDEEYKTEQFRKDYPMHETSYVNYKCGDDLTWTLTEDGKLTISGTGAMTQWDYPSYIPWHDYLDQIRTIIIEEGVTSIEDRAFEDCTSLASVTIPSSVTSIGVDAFWGCTSLTAFHIASGNACYCDIDGVLFSKDKSLLYTYPTAKTAASYTIPEGVTSIGDRAFYGCKSLTSVTIPSGVTSIGEGAFAWCHSLTAAIIPEGMVSIGDGAFFSTRLTKITIPSSVTNIGHVAFGNCVCLTAIHVMSGNQEYCDVDGVLFNKDKSQLYTYPATKTATSYTIPSSVTSIGDYAFDCCYSLTRITIPSSVSIIGEYAFSNCISLTCIKIPSSVSIIGNGAFWECTSLTDVYYVGTEEQLYDVTIGYYNDPLVYADFHFSGVDPYTPGDADGNGAVNTTDVILVRRYIAGGYNVTIDENAADVDGNGVINTTDVILMRRFIAGGYGVVLKPGKIA